jgi:hypothetical protein
MWRLVSLQIRFGNSLESEAAILCSRPGLGRAVRNAAKGAMGDWRFLEEKFGAVYTDKPGHPPLPTRLMAGLAILKNMLDLSDEALCEHWIDLPPL